MAKFPFGCWSYYPINKVWDSFVKDHHDLGLTVIMSPIFNNGDDPAKMLKLLDECQEYGMKMMLHDERVTAKRGEPRMDEASYRARFQHSVDQFGWHPSVMGFYVGDEPDAPDASNFFHVARMMRDIAPQLTPYLNLLPWFDWIGERIGSPAYGPYLDRAVKEGNLAFLSYDCYAQMLEGDTGWNDYFTNLREMRDASKRHGIPFHSIVLTSGHYDYLCPDQDDMRWQISTAAALGAKAISYFVVYQGDRAANYRCIPLNRYHERTPAYSWLADETRMFQDKHGDLMQYLTCEKSEFTKKAYGGLGMFTPDDTLVGAYNAKDINMLISTFTGPDGTKYRAIVNMDRKKNIEAKLAFAPGVRIEKMNWNNTWVSCGGYSDAVGALSADGATASMWMAPGQLEIIRES